MLITQKDLEKCPAPFGKCNQECQFCPKLYPYNDREDWGRTVCYAIYDYKLFNIQSPHHTFYLEGDK